MIQPQVLLFSGGMDVPEDDIVKIDRICLVHIKEEAICRKGKESQHVEGKKITTLSHILLAKYHSDGCHSS